MIYDKFDDALDLLLPGIPIHTNQLRVIQEITKIKEIKDLEVRANFLPGMEKLRRWGWRDSEIGVSGLVGDKRILNTLCNPPEGEGIINFLKKYDLARYVYSGPFQVMGYGLGVKLCVGGMKHPTEAMDDSHYHIHLELLDKEGFDYYFEHRREMKRKAAYLLRMHD